VPDRDDRSVKSAGAPVRRYRLARLRFEGRSIELASRFEHLKRSYD
jgi:hypothetical protein